MKPIDQVYWGRLTEKQKWDSIVGLRGPDLGPSGTIKWFTTSVIRHRLSAVMRVGGQVNPDLNAVIVPSGVIFPSKPAYPGVGGKIWKMLDGEQVSIQCSHPCECEVCKTLTAELDWHRGMPGWDYTHWTCHTIEAANELDIPIFLVEGKRWWEILSARGLKSSTQQLIDYFSSDRAANPAAMKELERHLVTLSTGSLGGW